LSYLPKNAVIKGAVNSVSSSHSSVSFSLIKKKGFIINRFIYISYLTIKSSASQKVAELFFEFK